jgi:hypothetical protein
MRINSSHHYRASVKSLVSFILRFTLYNSLIDIDLPSARRRDHRNHQATTAARLTIWMKETTTKGVTVVYLRKCTLVCRILNAISRKMEYSWTKQYQQRQDGTSVCRLPTLELSLLSFLSSHLHLPFAFSQSSGRGGSVDPSLGS